MSRPLKDKDGNIVLCGCDNGKCGHVATVNIGLSESFIPLCEYHYRLYEGGKTYGYRYNLNGIGVLSTLIH